MDRAACSGDDHRSIQVELLMVASPVSPERRFACLTFSPSTALVPAASRLVSDFCAGALVDQDTRWRFHMAAQELAENIVKYASSSPVTIQVELEPNGEGHVLRVLARNETTPERLEEISQRLAELNDSEPIELYDQLARESAPLHGVSGLGLVRIRAEGDLNVDYSIEGRELTIFAHAPVQIGKDS